MIYKYIFSDFFKDYKHLLLFWIFFILIFYVLQIGFLPFIFGKMTTNISFVNNKWDLDFNKMNTFSYLIILLIILLFIATLEKLRNIIEAKVESKYLLYLRELIFKKILNRYRTNFNDVNKGEIITRLITITNGIWDSIYMFSNSIFQRFIGLFIIIIYFCTLNRYLGFLSATFFIGYCFLFYKNIYYCLHLSLKKEKKLIDLSEDLHDSLSNLMDIYINNQEENIIEKNNAVLKEYGKNIKTEVNSYGRVNLIHNIYLIVLMFILIMMIYYLLNKQDIKASLFVSLLIVIGIFLNNAYAINKESYPFLLKIVPLINSNTFLNNIFIDKTNKTLKKSIHGKIELKDISYKYNNHNKFIFKHVNITIQEKQKIAIIGPSGSGKSTLCKLLLNLYQPNSGTIYIDNIPINEYQIHFLRKNIIYINQKTSLFNDTVLNNITFGNNTMDTRIKQIIHNYKLNVFDKLDYGIYTKVENQGANLSLGMQKIIFLLRGLLRDGKIIIMDEPLSGLNIELKDSVIRLIKDYFKEKTIIIITHDKEIIPFVDKVIDFNLFKNT